MKLSLPIAFCAMAFCFHLGYTSVEAGGCPFAGKHQVGPSPHDFHRASQTKPKTNRVGGDDHREIATKINHHLRATEPSVKSCASFSLQP